VFDFDKQKFLLVDPNGRDTMGGGRDIEVRLDEPLQCLNSFHIGAKLQIYRVRVLLPGRCRSSEEFSWSEC
jgi:hypothetical protein